MIMNPQSFLPIRNKIYAYESSLPPSPPPPKFSEKMVKIVAILTPLLSAAGWQLPVFNRLMHVHVL